MLGFYSKITIVICTINFIKSQNCPNDLEESSKFCHIPVNQLCPYKGEAPYWLYFQEPELKLKNDYEIVPVRKDPISGYYRFYEQHKFFDDVVKLTPGMEVGGNGDCLLYDMNKQDAKLSNCGREGSRICFYEKSSNVDFCQQYDKICNPGLVDTKCHCYSKYTIGYFCRWKCENVAIPEICKSCDQNFENYGSPKLQLSFDGDRLLLKITNFLKLKQLRRLDETEPYQPAVCYLNTERRTFNFAMDYPSDTFTFTLVTETANEAIYKILNFNKIETGVYWCTAFAYPNSDIITSNKAFYEAKTQPFLNYILVMNITNNLDKFADFTSLRDLIIYPNIPGKIRYFDAKLVGFHKPDEATIYLIGDLNESTPGNQEDLAKIIEKALRPYLRSKITSAQSCLGQQDLYEISASLSASLTWGRTRIGSALPSIPPCYDNENRAIVRKCVGNEEIGGIWGEIIGKCVSLEMNGPSKSLTDLLNSKSNASQIVDELLVIVKTTKLDMVPYDLVLIAKILLKISDKEQVYTLGNLVETIGEVMEFRTNILEKAQSEFNGTDMVLHAFDHALSNYARNFLSDSIIVSSKNLDLLMSKNLNSSILIYFRNKGLSFMNPEGIPTLDGKNIGIIVEFPAEFLNSQMDLITTVFKNTNLFIYKRTDKLTGEIPNIFLNKFGVSGNMSAPLKISIKPFRNYRTATFCAFWKYGSGIKGSWFKDHLAKRQDAFLACEFHHMTHFALLLDLPSDQVLDIISMIGSGVSLFAVFLIYLTAVFSAKWRESDGSKISMHICATIVIQIAFLFWAESTDSYDQETLCLLIGIFLHYSTIAQFFWMLVMGILQYRKFIIVFTGTHEHLILIATIVGWLLPVLPISFTIAFARDCYVQDQYCFLTGSGLYYGVFLPIAFVVAINGFVFIRIFAEFCRKKSAAHHKQYVLYIKLSVFLYFILGLTWVVGLLNGFFQLRALSYLFSILASIQGLVLFWFYIVLNQDARQAWEKVMRRISWLIPLLNDDRYVSSTK